MRYIYLFILLLMSIISFNTSGEQNGRIEGVWELVSAKYTSPDETVEVDQSKWTQIKVITKSHFVFAGQEPNRAKVSGADTDAELIAMARSYFGGGGTYTVEGDTYTETVQYFMNPNYISVSVPYKIEIDGNQFIQSGILPSKSVGLEKPDVKLYEVYRRVE